MTLDEMIKAEQLKAQQNQNTNVNVNQNINTNVANVQQTQQVQQTYEQEQHDNTQQAVQQMQQNINRNTTIASSADASVDRNQFSLKAKKYEPTVLPEDFYTVKLIGIDKKESKDFQTGEMQPNFVWKFEVISDSQGKQLEKVVTITKWCKAYSIGERSNNYQYYMAIMQQTPSDGYNILDCIGKYARAFITQKSWNDQKTNLKVTKSVIEKLLPLKR